MCIDKSFRKPYVEHAVVGAERGTMDLIGRREVQIRVQSVMSM
jgi:hypothetical protein